MSRVSIVFDRLRTEEKMLHKAAEDAGHDVIMIDAKTLRLGTGGADADNGFGDVVAERCVSYFRGLHVTAALESRGIPVVNSFAVASSCGNKMFMTLRLDKAGIPSPRTFFSFTAEAARDVIDGSETPLVIKPVIGSWGRGIVPLYDTDTADAVLEMRQINDGPFDRIFYMQEIIKRPPRDIRVIVAGDLTIAAMYRRTDGGFATNIAQGAEPEPCPITPEIGELAARAAEAVGGGVLGVDMMEDPERGVVVHEVNNTVEFKGLSRVSERDIAADIIEYIVRQART